MTLSTKNTSWLPSYLIVAFIWGFSFYFVEILLIAFHPTLLALVRLAIGGIVLLIINRVMKLKLPFKIWKKLFLMALLMNSLPGFLFAFAQDYISSILAGIINASTPLFTLLLLMLVFRDQKVTGFQIIGLITGFIGVLVVLGIWTGIASGQAMGVLAILLATVGYGYALPYYKRNIVPLDYPPISLMALQVSISALQIAPFAMFNLELRSSITPQIIFVALMLGGFGSGVAYVLHYQVTARAGAAIASTVTYVTPIVAAVAGVTLLKEELHWYEFAGATIVVLGVVISQRQKAVS
jgi:drug/metabolite transporter (DMT)-like permease